MLGEHFEKEIGVFDFFRNHEKAISYHQKLSTGGKYRYAIYVAKTPLGYTHEVDKWVLNDSNDDAYEIVLEPQVYSDIDVLYRDLKKWISEFMKKNKVKFELNKVEII